jgi:hypothetical protein
MVEICEGFAESDNPYMELEEVRNRWGWDIKEPSRLSAGQIDLRIDGMR